MAKALSSALVQGVFISTKDDSPLPVIDFSLKRAIINSIFSPFTGEMGAAGRLEKLLEEKKETFLGHTIQIEEDVSKDRGETRVRNSANSLI